MYKEVPQRMMVRDEDKEQTMRLIDADAMVTVMLYDEEHEEYYTARMTIAECLDRYTEEGCPWKGADDD